MAQIFGNEKNCNIFNSLGSFCNLTIMSVDDSFDLFSTVWLLENVFQSFALSFLWKSASQI